MPSIIRKTTMASALAIAAIVFSNMSIAQTQKCIGDNCPQQGQGMNKGTGEAMPENNGDNMPTKKLRKHATQSNDQVDMQNGEDQGDNGPIKKLRKKGSMSTEQYQQDNEPNKKMGQANFHFDPTRHHRRHHRDATFRFFFGGYWYDQPYWQEDYYVVGGPGYGISCRQGFRIVAERFNHVRVAECQGRTYTYFGRRHGNDFQIVLSSRSGRIIDVNEI